MRYGLYLLSLLVLIGGCGQPSLLITPVQNPRGLEEHTLSQGRGYFAKKIALIDIDGVLLDMKLPSIFGAEESKLSLLDQQLRAAGSDHDVKAVVLRINSPGGSVTASDTMYELVKRFKKNTGKPVIAATQEVAASGAYYIACASDVIVAHPTSVIGSIGVIFQTFNLQGTMQLLGVRPEAIKSGPMKDMASPFRPLDDDSRKVMQGMIDEYYARFVGVVTGNRPLKGGPDKVKLATDGRVFTGAQAVEIGLADRTGLLDDAIDLARKMADAPGAKVIAYRKSYGFSGSIYSQTNQPVPQASGVNIELPAAMKTPAGFYYLWQP